MTESLAAMSEAGELGELNSVLEERAPLVDKVVELAAAGSTPRHGALRRLLELDRELASSLARVRERTGAELQKIAQLRTASRGYARDQQHAGRVVNVGA